MNARELLIRKVNSGATLAVQGGSHIFQSASVLNGTGGQLQLVDNGVVTFEGATFITFD